MKVIEIKKKSKLAQQSSQSCFSTVYLSSKPYKSPGYKAQMGVPRVLPYLLDDRDRHPEVVYAPQNEFFDWEYPLREEYEKTSQNEQNRRYEEIAKDSHSSRRRHRDLGEFQRPGLFA